MNEKTFPQLQIADAAPVGIAAVDGAGRQVYVNEAFCALVGFDRQELVDRRPPFPYWPEEETEHISAALESALSNPSRDKVITAVFGHKDGRRFPVEIRVRTTQSGDGSPLFIATAVDITNRLSRQQALSDSEALFHDLVEHIDEVFYVTKADLSKLLYISPAYERIWGRSAAELYEDPIAYTKSIAPEYAEAVSKATMDQTSGKVAPVEYEIIRPDGERRWIRDVSYPIVDAGGRPTRIVGVARDITARKLTELQLKTSERRLLEAQQVAQVGSWYLDVRTDLIDWSEQTYRIFGLPLGVTVTVERFFAFTHPEDVPSVREAWNRAVATNGRYEIEHRILSGDGVRWVREEARLEQDREGKVTAAIGTVADITDRVENTARLAESERMLRLTLAAGKLCIWSLDVATKELQVDEGYKAIAGVGLDEWAPHQGNWADLLHPDDREAALQRSKAFSEGTADEYLNEYRLRHKLGHWVWIRSWGQVADREADGRPRRIFGVIQDISQEKASIQAMRNREHLLTLVQSIAGLGFLTYDPASKVVTSSEALDRILGLAQADEASALDRLLAEIGEEDRERVRNFVLDEYLVSPVPLECALHPEQGVRRVVELRRFSHRESIDGSELRIITLQDVTVKLQAMSIEKHAQKTEALARLSAGMAHDFNNLLAIITGSLEMIGTSGALGEDAKRYSRLALDASQRAADVTRSLLTLAGESPYKVEATDINRMVRNLGALIRQSAGARVHVTLHLSDAPIKVLADRAALESSILNLVINARDAMPEGGALAITTRTGRSGDGAAARLPGPYATIEIADSGTGMPERVRDRAFDPFFTTKERGHGTGLGLALVNNHARAIGGWVELASEVGRGTTVTLCLPVSAPAEADGRGEPAGSEARPAGRLPASRVLLVEDERGLREVTTAILEHHGFSVTSATNGAEALDILSAQAFDVMVCDVVMPGKLDGMQVARRAAERDPGMPIIMVTGLADQIDPVEWPVLRKPYSAEKLLQALSKAGRPEGRRPA